MAFRAYIFLLNHLIMAEIAWAFGNMDHIWIVRFVSMVRKCFNFVSVYQIVVFVFSKARHVLYHDVYKCLDQWNLI